MRVAAGDHRGISIAGAKGPGSARGPCSTNGRLPPTQALRENRLADVRVTEPGARRGREDALRARQPVLEELAPDLPVPQPSVAASLGDMFTTRR